MGRIQDKRQGKPKAKVVYRAPVWVVSQFYHGSWRHHEFADWRDALRFANHEG